MADVGHHNSAAWLDHFELRRIDASKQPALATLAPKASAGHATRFATPNRLERLGQHLSRLSGSAVRVTLAAGENAASQGAHAPSDNTSPEATSRGGTSGGGGGGIDRRDALGLPIVRDAFEVFPDAILVDARKEAPPPTQTPTD